MKTQTLFQRALDSLPPTLRGAFDDLYETKARVNYQAFYRRVLRQLTFRILVCSNRRQLLSLDAPLVGGMYFIDCISAEKNPIVWLCSVHKHRIGDYGIIPLREADFVDSDVKISIYYDRWGGHEVSDVWINWACDRDVSIVERSATDEEEEDYW